MIPAKTQCPTDWTLEYVGYLMTAWVNTGRTMYECVDKDPESIPGLNFHSNPRAIFTWWSHIAIVSPALHMMLRKSLHV